ncbi:hypothetical protein CRUP_021155, partial [Coryphaenoides rupestris]
AVEACVLHGLKRRAAGFLRSNKVAALFTKVGKSFPPAHDLCRKTQELEHLIDTNEPKACRVRTACAGWTRLPSLAPHSVQKPVLDRIVVYLVENSRRADHFWTDPSADELVQRHRIHGGHCRQQDSPSKRPALRDTPAVAWMSVPPPPPSARDYVESLHQNNRATLLFGKNNVLVQPRDDMQAIPGYLSLHQTAEVMTLKWTPNQLMNGSVGDLDYERSVFWDYAMTILLQEIVYLHCHQQVDSGGTVVLVSQDGIQRPPLRFPKGGHLLQFLSCLETGLLPHGQLDPPLWSQRGKGKVFPKLRKRVAPGSGSSDSVSDKEEDEATDYVFRILFPNSQSEAPLKLLCDNMKNQIISRAFYGWLAYCRHLSTVRTHLSALVNHAIVEPPADASAGLTARAYEEKELLRLVYFGGVEPSLRKEVDERVRAAYQRTMGEWLGCEAIVRRREKQQHAAAIAKCSSGASVDNGSSSQALVHRDSTLSNESSQSCSSDRQSLARLQSDSSSSTQVFESVEEVEQIEAEEEEAKGPEARQAPRVPNGVLQNGTGSPDSGHPSSRNFSVTSGLSDGSLSTEDSGACVVDLGAKTTPATAPLPPGEHQTTAGDAPAPSHSTTAATAAAAATVAATATAGSGNEAGEGKTAEWRKNRGDSAAEEPNEKTMEAEMDGKKDLEGHTETVVGEDQEQMAVKDASVSDSTTTQVPQEDVQINMDNKRVVVVVVGPKQAGNLKSQEAKASPVPGDVLFPKEGEVVAPGDEAEGANIQAEDVKTPAAPLKGLLLTEERPSEAYRTSRGHQAQSDSESESPSALEMEEIPKANVSAGPWDRKGRCEGWSSSEELQTEASPEGALSQEPQMESLYAPFDPADEAQEAREDVASQASTQPTYSQELLDLYTLNLHRIDKDVQRCDRNYWYFTPANLEKLRNIMCSCFTQLMKRMNQNFPHGGAMDTHFANMRSLIQILDSELFELMHQNGDYTHFYFCYRWFLLDFKRELVYDDVFSVWETIWVAKDASSGHFVLFIALALVEIYRDIILENNMDFTDIIKFFNEMAEHHNIKQILPLARELVCKVQMLIENK